MAKRDRPEGMLWLDWAGLLLLTALTLVLCVSRSRTRLLWSDETFSFTLLREGNLLHALRGWWAGADGGGVFYYVLGAGWFRLFGATPLSLRLFTTAAFAGAVALIWRAARRFYPTPIVALAIATVAFLPRVMAWQIYNGRFYGFFFFAAAWTSSVFLRTMSRDRIGRGDLLETGLSHLCLVGSHVLGVLYSGSLLVGMVVTDRLSGRRPRWALYGSAVVAWALVPISFHAIRATTGIAKGVFWTKKPHLADLPMGFFSYSRTLLGLALLLAAAAAMVAVVQRRRLGGWTETGLAGWRQRLPVATLIGALLTTQLTLFVISQRGLSLYADRYLIPLAIAAMLLLAELMTQVWEGAGSSLLPGRTTAAAVVTVLAVVLCWRRAFTTDPYASLYPGPGVPAEVSAALPPGDPVVVTLVPVFTMNRLFDPAHHYIFVTDWAYDLDPARPPMDASGQRLLENWRAGGFAADSILDLPEVVRQNREFTLVAEDGRTPWVESRFGHTPKFELRHIGALRTWYPMEIWHVHRTDARAGQ